MMDVTYVARSLTAIRRCVAAIIALMLFTGCATRVSTDPIKDMTNREISVNWRIEAARQAERDMPADPKRIEALHKLVWDGTHPDELCIYAIDQLLAIDEKDFRSKLDRRIVLIPYGPALNHIYEIGKERKWPDLTPMLVKRWAVPQHGVPEADRTERKWIADLNPGRDPEAVVFGVFTSPPDKISDLQRIGAWSLLQRISTKEKLIQALESAPQATVLVSDLKAGAADLHALPRHREGVKWLYFLRDPNRAAVWQAAKANVAALTHEQRINLSLRHLAILPHLDAATRAADRETLFRDLAGELAGRDHHYTSPLAGSLSDQLPQQLMDWKEKLSWGDLATMRTLWRLLQDPSIKASLFAQADRDLANTASEHGGVIDILEGKPIAREYPPLMRISHDRQFTPSEQMITHCYTGLAHYHFHAQEKKNGEYASPGKGDLDTADRLELSFLVLTFIDANRLNVDYYQDSRVVVDLGTLTR